MEMTSRLENISPVKNSFEHPLDFKDFANEKPIYFILRVGKHIKPLYPGTISFYISP